MRKQGIGAGLRLSRFVNVFGAAILLLDCVVLLDCDASKTIAVTRESVAKHAKVGGESEQPQRANSAHDQKYDPLHEPEFSQMG